MSAQALTDFLQETSSNEDMARDFVAALDRKSGAQAYQAVSAFASTHGYAVSDEDAQKLHSNFLAMEDAAGGELSDEQLSEVSGGELFTGIAVGGFMLSVGTLAVGTGIAAVGSAIPGPVGQFFRKW